MRIQSRLYSTCSSLFAVTGAHFAISIPRRLGIVLYLMNGIIWSSDVSCRAMNPKRQAQDPSLKSSRQCMPLMTWRRISAKFRYRRRIIRL